jgi:CBS domain-containing protein
MDDISYTPIALLPMKLGAVCRQPSTYRLVQLETPAIDVMTDFQVVSPAMVRPDATLAQAATMMVSRGVRFLFVIDGDDAIVGVFTARDLTGERVSRRVRERGCQPGELRVEDAMTPRDAMQAMPLAEVMRASVGNVLATLKSVGRQHALVIERHPECDVELVRGIFSATHIGRRLGVPIHSFEVSSTFAEIETALAAA